MTAVIYRYQEMMGSIVSHPMWRWIVVAVACVATGAQAQKPANLPNNYPSKLIRVTIASAPGGSLDISGRAILAKLNERWGNVISENRPGNTIAFVYMSKAAADGYNLMVSALSLFVGAEQVIKVPYDIRAKFPLIAQFITTPYIVVINNDLPVGNVNELIAYARANPGKLNYGFSSLGGAPHLFGELLKAEHGADMQGIPFKGLANAYVEQIAGRINLTLGTATSAGPLIKAGKIKAIAVTSGMRTREMPDLPTAQESLPGFDPMAAWVGLFGVEGMSPAIINALNREVNDILQLPDVQRTLAADGSEVAPGTPEQFRKVIATSLSSTARIIKLAGIKME